MDDETLRLISQRQDRIEASLLRFEARYLGDQNKLEEWRSDIDRQVAMVPVMTASFQRMAQFAGATVVTIVAAAVSIVLFGSR